MTGRKRSRNEREEEELPTLPVKTVQRILELVIQNALKYSQLDIFVNMLVVYCLLGNGIEKVSEFMKKVQFPFFVFMCDQWSQILPEQFSGPVAEFSKIQLLHCRLIEMNFFKKFLPQKIVSGANLFKAMYMNAENYHYHLDQQSLTATPNYFFLYPPETIKNMFNCKKPFGAHELPFEVFPLLSKKQLLHAFLYSEGDSLKDMYCYTLLFGDQDAEKLKPKYKHPLYKNINPFDRIKQLQIAKLVVSDSRFIEIPRKIFNEVEFMPFLEVNGLLVEFLKDKEVNRQTWSSRLSIIKTAEKELPKNSVILQEIQKNNFYTIPLDFMEELF